MPGFHSAEVVDARFWKYVTKTDRCWLWSGDTNDWGYGRLSVQGKPVRAHRYSYEKHYGVQPGKRLVCHTCDVPNCVRPDHLFLGTDLDNSRDAKRKGMLIPPPVAYGEDRWNAKLTRDDVLKIRDAHARGGVTHAALADKFDVSRRHIGKIVSKQEWAWV